MPDWFYRTVTQPILFRLPAPRARDFALGFIGRLEMLNQREQRAAARETQLANDLELERAKLNDLNDRLNALELEMASNRP